MYDTPLLPQWADLQPFAMAESSQFRPAGPPALESQTWATALAEVQSLGRADSAVRTADQTQIARFWADGPGTYTPPGHWNRVAQEAAQSQGGSLGENARLFAQLNLALADAAIVAWDSKYVDKFWRPVTALREADTDGNELTAADPAWSSFLITPPFPEYVSGHSTFSGAASAVLTSYFGEDFSFSTTSLGLPGVSRSFASFDAAAEEAGRSRIYGGIHYEFSNQDGLAAGRALAEYVVNTFSAADDLQAPRIVLTSPPANLVTAQGFDLTGRVLDNLAGVASLASACRATAAPTAATSCGCGPRTRWETFPRPWNSPSRSTPRRRPSPSLRSPRAERWRPVLCWQGR
jgi:hypothetical protein